MAKNLPEIFEEMRQALMGKRPGHRWGESANEAVSATVDGLKGFGGDTLLKTAERLNEAMPYIERAGYDIIEIEVGLGLSPKVVALLVLKTLLDEEEQLALLEEVRTKKLVHTILNSLFKASEARRKLKFKRFHFTHIELELSLLPTVVLKFRPNEETLSSTGDTSGMAEAPVMVIAPEPEGAGPRP